MSPPTRCLPSSYTGIAGGLVVLVADDPGMHSSQNEQDSRHYARAAKVPMLEPSDSQEAYDFTRLAFQLSEEFDTPVLLRTTTRLSHGKSTVRPRNAETELPAAAPPHDPTKYVMIPGVRPQAPPRGRRSAWHACASGRNSAEITRAEYRDRKVGIITSGINYQYVREVAPEASVLKLGMVHPLPMEAIRAFAAEVETLYVVEELDPFIEEQIRAAGIAVIGKERFPIFGELSPALVAAGAGHRGCSEPAVPDDLPAAPARHVPGLPASRRLPMLKRSSSPSPAISAATPWAWPRR